MIAGRIAVLELRSVRGTGGGPEKTILLGAARANRSRFDVTVCYLRDVRDEVFGGDACLDQAGGRRDLYDRTLAGPAGIFRPARDDHFELGRDYIQTL